MEESHAPSIFLHGSRSQFGQTTRNSFEFTDIRPSSSGEFYTPRPQERGFAHERGAVQKRKWELLGIGGDLPR
jgi:hypothetical protein